MCRSTSPASRADRRVYRPPTYDCSNARRRKRTTEKSSPAWAPAVRRAHLQHADVERAGLPGQLRADIDRCGVPRSSQADAPREERHDRFVGLAREIEEARPLEEEVALLLEEQRKPREVDAALIDFGLGEIGVDADVRAQRRREVVERVEADVAGRQRIRSAAPRRRRHAADHVRLDVEAQPLRHARRSLRAGPRSSSAPAPGCAHARSTGCPRSCGGPCAEN